MLFQVPHIQGDVSMYGSALPMRLNPAGYGRNMSLFLVMKRYDMSLASYLDQYRATMTPRTSLFLLTQLMEAVAFLSSQVKEYYEYKRSSLKKSGYHIVSNHFPGLSLVKPLHLRN